MSTILDPVGGGGGSAYQDNLIATIAPTATDDSAAGYSVGSRWIDVTNDRAYTCTDSTPGAAVWVNGTAEVGGGGVVVDGNTNLFHLSSLSVKSCTNNNLYQIVYSPKTGTLLATPGGSAYTTGTFPRSVDGGVTWVDSGSFTGGRYYVICDAVSGNFYAFDDFNGYIRISEDDGLTWRLSSSGNYFLGQTLGSSVIWAMNPETNIHYFYKADGTDGYYTSDFDTFTQFTPTGIVGNFGLSAKYGSNVDKPIKINGVYTIGTTSNGVYTTSNFIDWNWIPNTNTDAIMRVVYGDPNTNTIWCFSSSGLVDGMYKSEDNGVTWVLHSSRFGISTAGNDITAWYYDYRMGVFITSYSDIGFSGSVDGINWTGYTSPSTARIQRAQWIDETKQFFLMHFQATSDAITVSR